MGARRPLSIPRPADRRLYRRRRLAIIAAAVLTYALFRLAGLAPGIVESVYAGTLGAWVAWPLSRVSGILPFGVLELLVVAVVVRQFVGGGVAVWELARRRRNWQNALAAGALRLGQDAGILVILFYALWGFNYVRMPLPDRAGLPPVDSVSVEELAALARDAVDSTNAAYLALHGREDAGRPTIGTRATRDSLFAALDLGWDSVREVLGLSRDVSWRYGRPKAFVFSGLFKRLGVSGMYSPFTGEALVLEDLPATSYPKAAAHEQAHQRGIAHEAEANFLGYLAAVRAPHPHARYSGHAFALRQLLATLRTASGERWAQEAERILPGVRRDYEHLVAWWAQYEGPLEDVGTRVNDTFLRTNRIPEGVVSYSRSVELMIAFARRERGVSSGPGPGDP